jgi:hypothetical protein
MRKQTLTLLAAGMLALGALWSFKPAEAPKFIYMQLTTVESIIPAGLGRSKLLFTHPDGTSKEEQMENLYSVTGINFGNISNNNKNIVNNVNRLTAEGWELYNVTPATQSPSETSGQGIFLTRYLFRKAQ